MKQILHVIDMNPNKRGPVELQIVEMARQSAARGWRTIAAYAAQAPQWYADDVAEAGGELLVVPAPEDAGQAELARVLDELRPDLVHLHMVAARKVRGVFNGRKIPIVRTEHNWLPVSSPPRRVLRSLTMRWVDRHIAVSEAMARQLRREYLVPDKLIKVVYNGVDLDRFRPRPAEKQALRKELLGLDESAIVVTSAAHLIPRKRIDLLIEAFTIVVAAVPAAQLVVAGAGPELTNLEKLIADRGLTGHARILTGDNDVAALYAASDIGALVSWSEGLGGAAVEAMSSGLPLVAAPSDGLAEVAEHEVSGIYSDGHAPAAVAAALLRLIKDPELRTTMGHAARLRAEHRFALERNARETLDVYTELLR